MTANVSTIVSGLKLLTFQGITVIGGDIVVATVEGEILRVDADRNITPWVNLFNYGIPTGIVNYNEGLAVVLSAQESGHFLMRVTPQGQVSLVAELSQIVGEFGAPFGVSVHKNYYPYYIVAASTDVIGSAGLVARVSPSGQVSVLASLPSSCFGIVGNYPHIESNIGDGLRRGVGDRIVVTQEDGRLLEVALSGKVTEIVNLGEIGLGSPLAIACNQDGLAITTSTGWVVLIDSQGKSLPLINLVDAGVGEPTTITSLDNDWIVATKAGNLLRVS